MRWCRSSAISWTVRSRREATLAAARPTADVHPKGAVGVSAPIFFVAARMCHQTQSRRSIMSEGIQGKVVLITGGGTGLGAETARLLASKGAVVAVAGRRKNKLDEVVAQIINAGGRAGAYQLDVVRKEQV